MAFAIDYFHERVLAEIESWPVDIQADYAHLVELLIEHGPSLRMPHSRSFGDGLFELRLKGAEGIARVFYCTQIGQHIVMLHCFVKKTQKTPPRERRIAEARLKEIRNANP